MMNQTIIVGRIVNDPTLKEVEDKKVCNITLAVPRSFKNANGEYETDFLPISLWNGSAESTAQYCKKGDLIGVRGMLTSNKNGINISAERVTFLSSKKINDTKDEEIDKKI